MTKVEKKTKKQDAAGPRPTPRPRRYRLPSVSAATSVLPLQYYPLLIATLQYSILYYYIATSASDDTYAYVSTSNSDNPNILHYYYALEHTLQQYLPILWVLSRYTACTYYYCITVTEALPPIQ